MTKLKIDKNSFQVRDYQKPVLDFTDTLATMQKKVKIRIHKSIAERVSDYCGDEQFSPDGDEHYLVDFPFVENDYYYDILLSFGARCECLTPDHVRQEMIRRINDVRALYEN